MFRSLSKFFAFKPQVRGVSQSAILNRNSTVIVDWRVKAAGVPTFKCQRNTPHWFNSVMLPISYLYGVREGKHVEVDSLMIVSKMDKSDVPTKEKMKMVLEWAKTGLPPAREGIEGISITGFHTLNPSKAIELKDALKTLPVSVTFKKYREVLEYKSHVITHVTKCRHTTCLSGVILACKTDKKIEGEYFLVLLPNAEAGLKDLIKVGCNVPFFTSAYQPYIVSKSK